MNKKQKEVVGVQLANEKKILADLKKTYKQAEKDIDSRINELLSKTAYADENTLQSIIYQVDYQKALKKQIGAVLDDLNGKQFESISDYLTKSYEDGFIGALYDLQGQGVPLIFPIDQSQVVKAIKHDTKLSKSLYAKLGEDVDALKKRIQSELSRGISQSYSYEKIAQNIAAQTNIGFNKAMRIARTEGHRITQEATSDAQHKAKEAGADVVKQWDATLDSRTRYAHKQLNGQIRELDDPFEYGGNTAQYPGGFGIPSQDIHCRCVMLQRARWAVEDGEDDFTKWDGETGQLVDLSDAENYAEFKKKYKTEVVKPSTFYKDATWTMNPDGTFKYGKTKNEAQYHLDIDDDKVLTIEVDEVSDGALKFAAEGNQTLAKGQAILDHLPDGSIKDKFLEEASKNYTDEFDADAILKKVAGDEGYQAIKIVNKDKAHQDLFESYLAVVDDSLITKTKKSKLESLTTSLKNAEKKLSKVDNKTYTGIWKDPVSVSDYPVKKASIQAKKDWYAEAIEKAKKNIDAGVLNASQVKLANNQIATWRKYLDDLDEFETLGKQYETASDKVTKIKGQISKLKPTTSSVIGSADAYSQARKDGAYWFTDRNGSTRAADNVLRDKSGEVWRNATSSQRKAIHGYTSSYHKINEPLRGYEYGTNKYLGPGNVDLDTIGMKYSGFARGEVRKQIEDMTDIISKSSYDFDIWVQRGCDYSGMDKFFGISPSDFYLSPKQLEAKLLDKIVTEHGFMSTAVSKGKGFGGNIILNIYAPRGTKMIYAEPFSAYGNGYGLSWDGVAKQSSFGGEAEMILQRGTQFKVAKVEKSGGTWYIDLEVVGQ